jgi:hypothetical protein
LTSVTSQPHSQYVPTPDPVLALLGEVGCPACRRAVSSARDYLTRLSSGGEVGPEVLGRLVSSRGLCPRHTEFLLARPDAAGLAEIYRQLVAGSLQDLELGPATCPACEQAETAADRVLETLLNDLSASARPHYKLHGGLCLPHLRRAARHYPGANVRWLTRFMIVRLTGPGLDLDLLAGWQAWRTQDTKPSATEPLAFLAQRSGGGDLTCGPCQAATGAERAELAAVISAADGIPTTAREELLCVRHVHDLARAAGNFSPDPVRWQAQCHARRLGRVLDGQPRLLGISPGWQSARARLALAEPECSACRIGDAAASKQLGCFRLLPEDEPDAAAASPPLCVSHLARLRAIDPRAGQAALRRAKAAAAALATDLHLAASKPADSAPEFATSACWRAARFLDGSVRPRWTADQARVATLGHLPGRPTNPSAGARS